MTQTFVQQRWAVALGLIVLGIRLAVFHRAGGPLPYYDEWVAVFNNTFLPVVGGQSPWSTLWIPHNEHVLATSKVIVLLGYVLNGYWDVTFLAAASAFVHAAEAMLLFRLVAATTGRFAAAATWLACALVFATPISGYNLLCGLQVCFSLADIALLGALFFVARWTSPWRSGAALVGWTIAGLLSLGSAIAIPAATFVAHVAGRRPKRGFWWAWGVSVLCVLGYLAAMRRAVGTRSIAEGIGGRVHFYAQLLGWPFHSAALGVAIVIAIVIAGVWWVRRPRGGDASGLPMIAGVGAFVATNLALIAISRPPEDFHMRHWETAALWPLALLCAVALLLEKITPWRTGLRVAIFAAVLAVYAAALAPVWSKSWHYMEAARVHRTEAVAYFRGILTSRRMMDERIVVNNRLAARDYTFFDDPVMRFTPHPVVYSNIMRTPLPALSVLSPEIIPARDPSLTSRLVKGLFAAGWAIAVAGVVLAAAAGMAVSRRL